MNETDWLTCNDPVPMLEFLSDWASERKIRLIACAIIRYAPFAGNGRTIWDCLPESTWYGVPTLNCQTVVESAERYADGLETNESWVSACKFGGRSVWFAEGDTFYEMFENTDSGDSNFFMAMALAVQNTVSDYGDPGAHPHRLRTHEILNYLRFTTRNRGIKLHSKHERRVSSLIRDIMGNPFRPVRVDPGWLVSNDSEVSRLARRLHEGRAFGDMPLLGSALEGAGCDDPEISAHCRLPTGHARGCWLVDSLLGRS